jgi:hypothetical protein
MITREMLIDNTGYSFRRIATDNPTEFLYGWFHTDEQQFDGVKVRFFEWEDCVRVECHEGTTYAIVRAEEFPTKLKNAICYAQMASPISYLKDSENKPSFEQARALLNGLEAMGEFDADFTASADGISVWIGNGFLLEYQTTHKEYQLFCQGFDWIAGSPMGLKTIYEKAQKEVASWHKQLSEMSANQTETNENSVTQ